LLPGREWRVATAEHPYTLEGLEIDVRDGSSWVEVGECVNEWASRAAP